MLSHMLTRALSCVFAAAALIGPVLLPSAEGQNKKPAAPKSLRLYVLDCGRIEGVSGTAFGFKEGDLKTSNMITPCFLIVHPRGTMMWDVGEIVDSAVKGPNTKQGAFIVDRPLVPQLAALGYSPSDITYLGLSHYHGDHVANANSFAGATWIVQKMERDAMFAPRAPDQKKGAGSVADSSYFSKLKTSKTVQLNGEDHDVFGDGTVVIKFSPGHTPGHQSLFLKLKKTGPVLLSGDLYHYPEEMTLKVVPSFDFNKEQTAKSRAAIEAFVAKNKAQLWIQHDYTAGVKRKIAPEFYD
jgi:N-acyl homoserine lactone hydrolase